MVTVQEAYWPGCAQPLPPSVLTLRRTGSLGDTSGPLRSILRLMTELERTSASSASICLAKPPVSAAPAYFSR